MTTAKNVKADANGVVLPETVSLISEAMLGEIQSFDDALTVINAVFAGQIVEADKVLGTGFGVADEKAAYIGVTFVILKADRNVSDKGEKGRFWSLHCVTKDGRKVILNDGGSGIADQLDALYERHPETLGKPMLVKKGLRASSYVHPTAGPSITYYLDTSGNV